MAHRRMFSKRITNSGRFLKMPPSSQALYFHLGMEADDDGIVEAYNVMKITASNEDDLRVLVAKKFIKVLNEDLVSLVLDWTEHNLIRADRKIDSIYKDLLIKMMPEVKLLEAKPRADTGKKTGEEDNGRPMDGIGKVRLGKVSIGKDKDIVGKADDWDFNKKLEELLKEKRRDLYIIGLYWQYKGFIFENYAKYQAGLKRELRSAKNLVGYKDEEIQKTMDYLQNESELKKWTLETIHKYIDEDFEEKMKIPEYARGYIK